MEQYKQYIKYLDADLAKCLYKTPLIKADRLGNHFCLKNLYLKHDGSLPFSHTFKDRGAVTAISYLMETNKKKISFASCGNMGTAIALVAARKNIKTYAIISKEANHANKTAIYLSGAKVIQYAGRFDEIDGIIAEFSDTYPDFPCINTNLMNIYSLGLKSLYYEIFEDLHNIYNEINIVVPTADGTLLKSLYEGYLDFKPICPNFRAHFIMAQPSGCAPIVRAFDNNQQSIEEWKGSITNVLSLSVNNPQLNGSSALTAIYESDGYAVCVDEMFASYLTGLILSLEGVLIDDVGGIVIGALDSINKVERLKDLPTVCLLTSNGLKTLEKIKYDSNSNENNKCDVIEFLKQGLYD
jgi:threonine synthase